jgi:hypothetical protein
MNEFIKQPFAVSFFSGLSGERRRAYIKQWILSGLIFLIAGSVAVIVIVVHPNATAEQQDHEKQMLVIFILALYGMQIIYSLIRKETLWQLRWRELRAIKEANARNLLELDQFAESQSNKVKPNVSK